MLDVAVVWTVDVRSVLPPVCVDPVLSLVPDAAGGGRIGNVVAVFAPDAVRIALLRTV